MKLHRAADDHHPGRHHRHHRDRHVPAALLDPRRSGRAFRGGRPGSSRAPGRSPGRRCPPSPDSSAGTSPPPGGDRQRGCCPTALLLAAAAARRLASRAGASGPAPARRRRLPAQLLRPPPASPLLGSHLGATLLYIALLRLLRAAQRAGLHPVRGDLLLITALVYYFGGIASPFSLLYLVVIAVASTLLRPRAGLTVASLGLRRSTPACSFCSPSAGCRSPAGGEDDGLSPRLLYNLAVHCFGFYAVALLTSYLAQQRHPRRAGARGASARTWPTSRSCTATSIQSITSGLITTDLDGAHHQRQPRRPAILGRRRRSWSAAPIHQSGLLHPRAVGGADRRRASSAAACAPRCELTRGTARPPTSASPSRRLTDAERPARRLHRHLPGPHPLAAARRRRCASRTAWRRWASWRPAWRTRSATRWRRSRARCRCSPAPRAATAAQRQADRHPAQGEPAPRPHDQGLPALRPAPRALERRLRHRPPAGRERRAAARTARRSPPATPSRARRSTRPRAAPGRRPRPGEPDLLEPGAQRAARRCPTAARLRDRRPARRTATTSMQRRRHRPRHDRGGARQPLPALPVLLRRRHRHRHGHRLPHRAGARRPSCGREPAGRRHHDHRRAAGAPAASARRGHAAATAAARMLEPASRP